MGSKMGPLFGSLLGSKMTPFWQNPGLSRPRPERGHFRGGHFWVNKMALFQKCQKCHFLDFERKLSTRARARASVFYGKRLGRGSKMGVTFGSLLGPPILTPFGHFPLYLQPISGNRGSKKGSLLGSFLTPFLDPLTVATRGPKTVIFDTF